MGLLALILRWALTHSAKEASFGKGIRLLAVAAQVAFARDNFVLLALVVAVARAVGQLAVPPEMVRNCNLLLRRVVGAAFDFAFAFVVAFVGIVQDFRKRAGSSSILQVVR